MDLISQAKKILAHNYLDKFTKPAPSLYPYQWNWDSGFIAMAYAHYEVAKACRELYSLFSGQWSNGMLPQIIFHHPSDLYFPGPDFWQTEKATHSNPNVPTSGITMPPVHGFVLRYMYDLHPNDEKVFTLIKNLWSKINHLHQYLYTDRDPLNEGLPYVRHPWESGTDNSPIYDQVYRSIDLEKAEIPDYTRKDLQSTEAEKHRPRKKDYDTYVYLVDLFRKNNYDDQAIYQENPFAVQDPLFISILSKSNQDMIYLGKILGKDVSQLQVWDAKTKKSMHKKLWDERGIYNAYDLKNDQMINVQSHSGFMPLFAGIPNMAEAMQIEKLIKSDFWGRDKSYYLCPSHAPTDVAFEAKRYWRGPVWLNINWMLHEGFARYDFTDLQEQIRTDSLELVEKFGFFEYFDSQKTSQGNGAGTNHFSWTAAIYLVLKHS